MIQYKSLLKYKIIDIDKNKLLKYCEEKIYKKEKCFIITLNTLILLNGILNKDFSDIIKSADLVIPDGSGIIWASKVLKSEIKNKFPGIDFMHALLGLAYEKKLSVFLLGAKPAVIERLFLVLKKWYDGTKFVGKYHGYFDTKQEKNILKGINKVEPDILFVALGSPKQEQFIYRNYGELKAKIIIGVGGSFDVISGFTKRAPQWFIKHNLEWLYRSFTSLRRVINIFKISFFVLIIYWYKIKSLFVKVN